MQQFGHESGMTWPMKALDAGDWQQELQLENHFLTQLQEYKSTDEEFSILNEDIKKTLALNAEHLASNIKPEHETYSTALPNFMKQIVDIFVNFGAILVLLIMVGDILTKEFKQRLNENHPIDIISTFMGAHAIPDEFKDNPDAYVELIVDEMNPMKKQVLQL